MPVDGIAQFCCWASPAEDEDPDKAQHRLFSLSAASDDRRSHLVALDAAVAALHGLVCEVVRAPVLDVIVTRPGAERGGEGLVLPCPAVGGVMVEPSATGAV